MLNQYCWGGFGVDAAWITKQEEPMQYLPGGSKKLTSGEGVVVSALTQEGDAGTLPLATAYVGGDLEGKLQRTATTVDRPEVDGMWQHLVECPTPSQPQTATWQLHDSQQAL